MIRSRTSKLRPTPTLPRVAMLLWLTALAPACGITEADIPPAFAAFETTAATFEVRESVEQLHITHALPDTELGAYNGVGQLIAVGDADGLGSLIFRELPPGEGYRVRETTGSVREESRSLRVMSVENSLPDRSFYEDQVLEAGFNYITTRDGTKLSVYVYLPGPLPFYPTIVGYSGYSPSKPGAPIDGFAYLCPLVPVLCDAPNHPAGLLGGFVGYATVGVNMRGTGCSGGAYDYFETLQLLDGYDMIEVIAAQDWVRNNKVGMAGLSYPGISQLFVAQTQPPGLAAIAPLSVIAETSTSTLAPGGIFNDGFALQWAANVTASAVPFGQGWEQGQVDLEEAEGIDTCAENQLLHGQLVDAVERARETPYYVPEIVDPLNPSQFVDKINVPVFLSGAWQDEQTGAHFATLLDKFTGSPFTRFTMFNGLHADGYAPQILSEWKAFFDVYVHTARKPKLWPPELYDVARELFKEFYGTRLELPTVPFGDISCGDAPLPPCGEVAKAAFEAQKQVRIIFDNGAAPNLYPGQMNALGAPQGAFERWFSQWPPAETVPLRLYFHEDGILRQSLPTEANAASVFDHDPEAGQRTLGGGQPFYDWRETPPGSAVVFATEALLEDTMLVGTGSVDLFVQSNADDADFEVTLSEIRPDNNETYVQSGWQRASQRALHSDASDLNPVKTHLEEDAELLPSGEWEEVRVLLFPFAHVFRAGSRIRIQIDTPGDSRELWKFDLIEYEGGGVGVKHMVAHSSAQPSSILLPLIVQLTGDEVEPITPLPPCPSLRGQPCRAYTEYNNVPFE